MEEAFIRNMMEVNTREFSKMGLLLQLKINFDFYLFFSNTYFNLLFTKIISVLLRKVPLNLD